MDLCLDEQRVKERLLQIDHEMNHAFKLRDADSSQVSVINVILGHIEKLKSEQEDLTETVLAIHEKLGSIAELNLDWQNPEDLMRKFHKGWELLLPFQRKRLLARTFKEVTISKDGFTAVCWPPLKKEDPSQSGEI